MPDSTALTGRRALLLFILLFAICCGLGYPVLNRANGETTAGLSDARTYAAMVRGSELDTTNHHMRFRLLVPYMARPLFWFAQGRVGTWDPAMFGLLVVDSLFTAGTALLLLCIVVRHLGSYQVALGAALIYLLNFAVPNLRLAGLVDAGEGFFLLLLTWSFLEKRVWTLPLWGILGALTKESFVPFMMVFTFLWCLSCPRQMRKAASVWTALGWCAAIATLTVSHWRLTQSFESPLTFGLGLHHNSAYFSHFFHSILDRQLWYVFIWLLPLSMFRLRAFPQAWLFATAATGATALAMNTFYGGAPGTLGRALFSIAGPLLSASVALLLFSPPVGDPPLVRDDVNVGRELRARLITRQP